MYSKYIFVCTNQRDDGRQFCGHDHGNKLVTGLKELIKEKGLNASIRANKAGCLDVCAYGASAVVYPNGVWYGNIENEDLEEIVEGIRNNKPVDRLKIDFNIPGKKWRKKPKQINSNS